jgi:hypothetical protein
MRRVGLPRRPRRLLDLIPVAGGDRAGVIAVIDTFRGQGRSFLTINPPEPVVNNTEIDVSHEALIRRWQQLSTPTRDPRTNEPIGWLWREFEDGPRWRALAVQARVFRDDKTKSATLTPATTNAFEQWWLEHTPAWAARYARDKNSELEEYREVEFLWQASKKVLELERIRAHRETQGDSEEIALLRQDVSAWNARRAKSRESTSALAGITLDGLNLAGADLAEADLTWTSLINADLTEAILEHSVLSSANLARANLRRANI